MTPGNISNQKGRLSEHYFVELAIRLGWQAQLVGEKTADVDAIVRRPGDARWLGVQVKTGRDSRRRWGGTNLRTTNRLKPGNSSNYRADAFDLLAVVIIPSRLIWVVPVSALPRDEKDPDLLKGYVNLSAAAFEKYAHRLDRIEPTEGISRTGGTSGEEV